MVSLPADRFPHTIRAVGALFAGRATYVSEPGTVT